MRSRARRSSAWKRCSEYRVVGIDLDPDAVALASRRALGAEIVQGSLYEIPFDRDQFDLCPLPRGARAPRGPRIGLDELARTGRSDLVVSVPYEPWFRAGSAMRGKHLRTLGNRPGAHQSAGTGAASGGLLERHVEVIDVSVSMPSARRATAERAGRPPAES